MTLFGWLRRINGKKSPGGNLSRRSSAARPCLEELEDRATPTTFDTITQVSINITPNFLAQTATETVTASVVNYQTLKSVTSGTLFFNLNGQTATVVLNGTSGTGTLSTSLPLYAVVANQTLGVNFSGATVGSDTYKSSNFLSPVYLNVLNVALPSQIYFRIPPVGINPFFIPFNTSFGGEYNVVSLFSNPITFHYIDPGTIDTLNILGFNLPGSFSSALFGDIQSTVVSAINQLI